MIDVFIDLVVNRNSYFYECEGKIKKYKGEQAEHENGRFLVIKCEVCSNVPVYHLLRKIRSVDDAEMAEILADKDLVERLKQGSKEHLYHLLRRK